MTPGSAQTVKYKYTYLVPIFLRFFFNRVLARKQEVIDTFRRNVLQKNLLEEVGMDRLVLVEGRSRR